MSRVPQPNLQQSFTFPVHYKHFWLLNPRTAREPHSNRTRTALEPHWIRTESGNAVDRYVAGDSLHSPADCQLGKHRRFLSESKNILFPIHSNPS